MYIGMSESIRNPQYNPLDPDILLSTSLQTLDNKQEKDSLKYIAQDYIKDNIRCNCISPARVHTPFVDGFIKKNYPGKEKEMFEKLSKTQPVGRMGNPQEIADLALFLCADEASFITGSNYGIDGGYVTLNSK